MPQTPFPLVIQTLDFQNHYIEECDVFIKYPFLSKLAI